MLTAESVRPSNLTASDRQAWAAFCEATPLFRSPLLGPDFADAVGRKRNDAWVAVFRQDGKAVGFLPYHQRSLGFSRPIGSPFSDYQALVTAPDQRLDAAQALALAGLNAFRFSHLLDPYGCFGAVEQTYDDGYRMQFGEGGAEAYLDAIRSANPKRAKNWRRLENKLEREFGEIELTCADDSQHAFDALIRWKREQLHRSGLHDFFRPHWSLDLMQDLFKIRHGRFQGLMITLRAGGQLVAGHFGVRLDGHFHSWISSVDPEAAACGPGNTILLRALEAMPSLGLTAFDMGPGHCNYKEPFCTSTVRIGAGVATAADARGVGPSLDQALALAAKRSEPVARLLRRLDHIAAVELSVGGRLLGVAQAFAGQGRRTREPANPEN